MLDVRVARRNATQGRPTPDGPSLASLCAAIRPHHHHLRMTTLLVAGTWRRGLAPARSRRHGGHTAHPITQPFDRDHEASGRASVVSDSCLGWLPSDCKEHRRPLRFRGGQIWSAPFSPASGRLQSSTRMGAAASRDSDTLNRSARPGMPEASIACNRCVASQIGRHWKLRSPSCRHGRQSDASLTQRPAPLPQDSCVTVHHVACIHARPFSTSQREKRSNHSICFSHLQTGAT